MPLLLLLRWVEFQLWVLLYFEPVFRISVDFVQLSILQMVLLGREILFQVLAVDSVDNTAVVDNIVDGVHNHLHFEHDGYNVCDSSQLVKWSDL